MGEPMAIRIWIKGDGSGHELRLAYRDGNNQRKTEDFEEGTLASTGWHAAVAKLPPDVVFPLKLESIYVLRNSDENSHTSGVIYLDDITALYHPE